MIEKWKDIPEFPDYAISNLGRVKRLTPKQGTWVGKILKARMSGEDSGNYYQVRIPNADIEYINLSVARLVAQAFVLNPENKPQVNHMDGDKANNQYTNLEWTTQKENSQHAAKIGLIAKGSRSGKSILTEDDIPLIRKMRNKGRTNQRLSDKFGVSRTCIQNVLSGRTWRHI